mgnify:CR=1 FL=1
MNKNSRFLEALVQGNSSVISGIYETSFPSVKKFIFNNKGQLADAEDIFQKALLQIAVRYQKEKFEIKTHFEAYLFTVCKNLWRRELNKHKNKVTNEKIIELHSEENDNAFAVLELKRQELFIEKLNLISINCKQILTLFFAKTPYNEIVTMLDYSSETVVRQRVFKCKKKLTDLIKNDSSYNSLREL